MIEWNLDPVLVHLGSLEIRYYGIIFVIGFIVSLLILLRAIDKGKLNLEKTQVYDMVFYGLLGVIIGSRLFHVIFWDLEYYLENPLKIFFIWEGGLSFHGGLVGVFIVAYFFSKKYKFSLWRFADILVLPAIFMLALGRIANFINQELYGIITDVPWCVKFMRADPLNCRHPVQLYAALGRFALFFVLLSFKDKYKDGFIFWNFVTLMGIGRLVIDFLRVDIVYFGLKSGQWLSVAMILIGGFMLLKFYREDFRKMFGFKKEAEEN